MCDRAYDLDGDNDEDECWPAAIFIPVQSVPWYNQDSKRDQCEHCRTVDVPIVHILCKSCMQMFFPEVLSSLKDKETVCVNCLGIDISGRDQEIFAKVNNIKFNLRYVHYSDEATTDRLHDILVDRFDDVTNIFKNSPDENYPPVYSEFTQWHCYRCEAERVYANGYAVIGKDIAVFRLCADYEMPTKSSRKMVDSTL